METIKAKLKKIAALAERGVGGERDNAKRLLELLLAKHNLHIEDVVGVEQELKPCWFKATKGERVILFQCYFRVTNQTTVSFFEGSGPHKGEVCIELKKLDAIELRAMWDHFRKLFRREVRRLLAEHRKQFELLGHAFVCKHNLFSAEAASGKGDGETLSREDLYRLMRLQADLEDANYVSTRRMIEG